jgi:hypothetical protein
MHPRKRVKVYHHVVPDDYSTTRHTQLITDSRSRVVAKPSTFVQLGYGEEDDWADEEDATFALDDPALYKQELTKSTVDLASSASQPKTSSKKSRSPRSAASVSNDTLFCLPADHWQRRNHLVWTQEYRGVYLDEFMQHEGRGDFMTEEKCPDCVARKVKNDIPAAEYRCRDCFIPDLVCSSCCVRRHRQQPLHRIEVSF